MFSNVYLWYGVVSIGSKSICIYGVHLRILGQCWTRPKDRLGSWGTSCSAYYGFDCNDYLLRVGITSLWLHLHRYRHHILQLKTRIRLKKDDGAAVLQGGDLLSQFGWKWPSR